MQISPITRSSTNAPYLSMRTSQREIGGPLESNTIVSSSAPPITTRPCVCSTVRSMRRRRTDLLLLDCVTANTVSAIAYDVCRAESLTPQAENRSRKASNASGLQGSEQQTIATSELRYHVRLSL